MDSLSLLSSYPLSYKDHPKTQKLETFKSFSLRSNHNSPNSAIPSSTSSPQPHLFSNKKISVSTLQTHSPKPLPNLRLLFPPQNLITKSFFSFAMMDLFTTVPCLAVEAAAPSLVESDAGKINLESVLVSIDNFFNRYPFFVAGCTFIWLVVIPLTQEYFKKCKFVLAIDAFRKLRDDPNSQLLDIRDRKNVKFLRSPNLKMLKKEAVQVEFTDGNEDEFVKKVTERFKDAPSTVVFVLDSFDGNSMKVAELLFKNGFKEAYAIRGGVRGQQGWMAIQDSLLPPSVHIRKKTKASKQLNTNGNGAIQQNDNNNESSLSQDTPPVGNLKTDNGHAKRSAESISEVKIGSVRSSSPYPNVCYPQLSSLSHRVSSFSVVHLTNMFQANFGCCVLPTVFGHVYYSEHFLHDLLLGCEIIVFISSSSSARIKISQEVILQVSLCLLLWDSKHVAGALISNNRYPDLKPPSSPTPSKPQ
ncbi:hypothetical protein VNO77_21116 [Canavalia gladiata]|uniref:Rhodanese domain-containing protein n=1 Tax=Canavalia gladiata TaxID=3824 RepID=A0AAN9QLT6_CANGL